MVVRGRSDINNGLQTDLLFIRFFTIDHRTPRPVHRRALIAGILVEVHFNNGTKRVVVAGISDLIESLLSCAVLDVKFFKSGDATRDVVDKAMLITQREINDLRAFSCNEPTDDNTFQNVKNRLSDSECQEVRVIKGRCNECRKKSFFFVTKNRLALST